jgi:hypothetical protein
MTAGAPTAIRHKQSGAPDEDRRTPVGPGARLPGLPCFAEWNDRTQAFPTKT